MRKEVETGSDGTVFISACQLPCFHVKGVKTSSNEEIKLGVQLSKSLLYCVANTGNFETDLQNLL